MLGFTQKEQSVLIFLSVCFIIGLGIKTYQQHWASLPDTPSEHIAVLNQPENREGAHQAKSISSPVININGADFYELQQIPGVGPVLAKRILDFREKDGNYGSVNDLMKVKGIGKKTLEKLRPFVRCD